MNKVMLALSMLIMQMLSQSGLTGASSGPLSLSSELAQEEPAVALRGSEQSNSESIPSWRVKLGLGPREVPVTGIFERERIESYVMDALDNCKSSVEELGKKGKIRGYYSADLKSIVLDYDSLKEMASRTVKGRQIDPFMDRVVNMAEAIRQECTFFEQKAEFLVEKVTGTDSDFGGNDQVEEMIDADISQVKREMARLREVTEEKKYELRIFISDI